jgi:hypothetical protein
MSKLQEEVSLKFLRIKISMKKKQSDNILIYMILFNIIFVLYFLG